MKNQWVVWFCFFLSGLSGLIYEVVWVRQFELVFGTGTYAVGAVLAAFMGGLSLGGWVGGKKADSVQNPLRAYGFLELLIGFYAFLLPYFSQLVSGVYLGLEAHFDFSNFSSLFIRFLGAFLLLILPTAFMGATLPFLSKVLLEEADKAGWKVGRLYGVNTLGAVLGVFFSGFVLVPHIGQSKTVFMVAGLNVVLGIIALLISGEGFSKEPKIFRTPLREDASPRPEGLVLFLAALSGFSALVYETCYTRILTMTLGGSVYAFSTMLATFLAGLSLGAWFAAGAAKYLTRKLRIRLVLVLAAAGLTALLTGFLFDRLCYPFFWFYQSAAQRGEDLSGIQRNIQVFFAAAVMLPTALFLGAAFPFLVRMGGSSLEKMGSWVGRVYSWNTLGAIVGSFLAAFVLIPQWGIQKTLLTGVFAHLAAAMVLSVLVFGLSKPWRVPAWAGGVGAVFLFLYFLPSWNQHRLSIGPYNGVIFLAQNPHFRLSVDERLKSADLLYYREGVASTVTVEKNKRSSNLVLANNGKPDASSLDDLPTEQLIPQLPLLWFECSRRRPAHRAALIGLASGISAGAALRHSLDQLTVVELEPSMSQAASLFRDSNFNVLADPKFRLVTDDGRHYLKLHPGEFDAVISEPSNPWISGVSNLFTRESFQTARNALTQEGVFSQWVQIYEMRPEDFKTIVRTFHSVFPYTYVFGTYGFDNPTQFEGKNHGLDLILVGAAQPLVPDMEIMDRVIREEKLQKALERIGIQESGDLISLLRLGPSEVSKFEGEGPLNGDDNALIEFSAPLNLYKDTRQENLKELYKYQEDPTSQVGTKSKAELKKILLRVASEFDLYWKKDLADQMRDRARHL